METHEVTVNGQTVAVARGQYKLLTWVGSVEHHDQDGKRVTSHELAIEGVDATGREVTHLVRPVRLRKGDLIQIRIGEVADAQPGVGANLDPA